MFENYLAKKKDFEAIEEGIAVVWRKEVEFIFKNKRLIKNTIVISYDSLFLYIWTRVLLDELERSPTKLAGYNFYKIKHKIRIGDDEQRGWCAGLRIKKIADYLPRKVISESYRFPKISGSLLGPFIKSHCGNNDAYNTRESYLATIVHEFGHVYFDQHKTFWYSSKKENLKYLKTALGLYSKKRIKKLDSFKTPSDPNLGEVFAFCTDYTAAMIFWPNHKHDIDRVNKMTISESINGERTKNLEVQNSVLDGLEGSHLLAMVFGKILITYFPKLWPQKLLSFPQTLLG